MSSKNFERSIPLPYFPKNQKLSLLNYFPLQTNVSCDTNINSLIGYRNVVSNNEIKRPAILTTPSFRYTRTHIEINYARLPSLLVNFQLKWWCNITIGMTTGTNLNLRIFDSWKVSNFWVFYTLISFALAIKSVDYPFDWKFIFASILTLQFLYIYNQNKKTPTFIYSNLSYLLWIGISVKRKKWKPIPVGF